MKHKKVLMKLAFIVIVISLCESAMADQFFESIQTSLTSKSSSIWNHLIGYGKNIFYILVIIDFTWSMISLFLDGEKPVMGDIVAELIRQIMIIGLFVVLVEKGWKITGLIIVSIVEAQEGVTGTVSSVSPQEVFNTGIAFVKRALDDIGWFDSEGLGIFIAAIVICVFCALIAVSIILVYVEMALVLATGGLIAGLSGTRWTRDYAITYLKYAVAVGLKLFLMLLISSVILGDVNTLLFDADSNDVAHVLAAIGLTVFGWFLIQSVPDVISGILQGVSVGNQGSTVARGASQTMSTTVRTAAMAAGGAVGTTIAIAQAAKYGMESAKQDSGKGNGSGSGGSLTGIGGKAFKAGAKALAGETGKQVLNNVTKSAESKHGSTSSRVSDGLKAKTEALKTQNMGKPYTSPAPDLTKPNAPKPDNPDK